MHVLWADATGELELSGTSLDLLRLVEALRLVRQDLLLDVDGDPAPYSKALVSIETRRTVGEVSISVSSDHEVLKIQGGAVALEMLGSNIEEFAAEGDCDSHLHIEYLPGHEYIAPNSEPLVVAFIK